MHSQVTLRLDCGFEAPHTALSKPRCLVRLLRPVVRIYVFSPCLSRYNPAICGHSLTVTLKILRKNNSEFQARLPPQRNHRCHALRILKGQIPRFPGIHLDIE